MVKRKSSFVTWLGYVVRGINICQLIGVIIAIYVVDKEDLENDWKYYPKKPLISDIHFDVVFGIWIFTLLTGLLHNLLFDIGEAKGLLWVLKISIGIGIIKEIVSFSHNFVPTYYHECVFLIFQVEIVSALAILISTIQAEDGISVKYLTGPILKLLFDLVEIFLLACHIKTFVEQRRRIILPTHETVDL